MYKQKVSGCLKMGCPGSDAGLICLLNDMAVNEKI